MSYIPNQVYDHIRYSSGGDAAGPCARMGDYTLHQEFGHGAGHVSSWNVYVVANLLGKWVPLSTVPKSKIEDWEILA